MTKRIFIPLRNESGQSMVEFALVLPLIVVVIVALVDFGRALHMYLQAEHAASDGARLAAVDYVPASGTLQNYLQQNLLYGELQAGSTSTAGAQGKGQVCIAFPAPSGAGGAAQRGDPVRVTVKSSYNWVPGGIIPGSITIGGSATMRLEQDPTFGAGCST